MDIVEFLEQYETGIVQGTKYNQYKTRPVVFHFKHEEIDKFNYIYKFVYNYGLNEIIRTNSGSIAKDVKSNRYAYDVVNTSSACRLTIIVDGKIWVFKVGSIKDEKPVSPAKAWLHFKKECSNKGIDLDNYKIDNGLEVKKSIPKAKIEMFQYMTKEDEGLTNVHHIDFHNSYPAGLVNTHPEFRPVIEPMYKLRKVNEDYKNILNYSIGCMQSKKNPWHANWAHLAKDAITDNNNRIDILTIQLTMTGRKILGFNTDGIWYQGKIFHGEDEGDNLGQWHNDHINCIFRSKSNGAYEFIEDGKYHPIVRGNTRLDKLINRDEWKWGDIYDEEAEIINYKFKEGEGLVDEK